MSDSTQQQLREAYNLIKAKKRQDAVAILLPILHANEDNVNAWWLLANALTKPDDAREALENVLRIKPDHENAQKMLQKLNERYPPPEPEPEPEPAADVFGFDDSASDPFAGTAGDAFGSPAASNADPFGSPETFGSPDAFGSSADSFGKADPFGTSEPAFRSSGAGDMDGNADPFDVLDRKPLPPKGAASSSKKGMNPLVIILAVVGVVAICGCLGCGVLMASSGFIAEQFAGELITELEGMDLEGMEGLLNTTQVQRGSINYGETKSDRLSIGEQHTWTFNGNSGDNVTIEMIASSSSDVDPYIYLYDASGSILADDDDGGGNLNSRLTYRLPSAGTYTIGAQSFGGLAGGSYELRLSR